MSATAIPAGEATPLPRITAPERIVITALRLLACPCGRDLQEGLRPASPAAHLVNVMQVIDRAARRPLRLNPPETGTPSADETALLNLIASVQAGLDGEAAIRARTLVKDTAKAALLDAVKKLADGLAADGIALTPAASTPPCGYPILHPVPAQADRQADSRITNRLSAGLPAG